MSHVPAATAAVERLQAATVEAYAAWLRFGLAVGKLTARERADAERELRRLEVEP